MSAVRAPGRPVRDQAPVLAVATHAPDMYASCVKVPWPGVPASRYKISLYLAYARILQESSRFEENLERDRAVAPPVAPESRLLRTVRGPGTPATDAAHVSVIARRMARCCQPPDRLGAPRAHTGPGTVVSVGDASAAKVEAAHTAEHGDVGSHNDSDDDDLAVVNCARKYCKLCVKCTPARERASRTCA